MSDVTEALPRLLRDLVESIAFKEMKFQRLPLLLRKLLPHLVQKRSAGNIIDGDVPGRYAAVLRPIPGSCSAAGSLNTFVYRWRGGRPFE